MKNPPPLPFDEVQATPDGREFDQPSEGGWRWHKWGPYVGDKHPEHEYLHDEGPEITQATCFHVYRVLS